MRSALPSLLALALLACGTPRPARSPTPPGGGLAAQLTRLSRGGPTPGDALVTYALLFDADPGPAEALRAAARPALRAVDPGHRRLSVVPAPVDAALPLNVAALVADAGPHAEAVRRARWAVFVRYSGPPAPDGAHITATARAALALLGGGVAVDLSTRRAFDAARLAAALRADDWLTDQTLPTATREADGTVTLITRGMPKLGLPDLEKRGLSPAQARAAFPTFQGVWRALVAEGRAEPGERRGGARLLPCVGRAERHDHECVTY